MHPQLTPLKARIRVNYKPLALLVLPLLIVGCATSPDRPPAAIEDRAVGSTAPQAQSTLDLEDKATPLEERNVNIERAEYYQQLANKTEPNSQIDSQLSAAEHYIQGSDFYKAEQAIEGLNSYPLSQQQRHRYDIVAAYIAFSRQDYLGALQQLDAILQSIDPVIEDDAIDARELEITPEAPIASEEPANDSHEEQPYEQAEPNFDKLNRQLSTQQVDALLLSSFCYQALNDYESAINALIQREHALVGKARAETTRYLWQVIQSISPEHRQNLMSSTRNDAVRNRLEQSVQGRVTEQRIAPSQFTQWRQDITVEQKQVLNDEWSSHSPRSIAVLLPLTSKYNKAAQALMDGIKQQDANNESPYRPRLEFYDIGGNPFQAPQYYNAAIQAGADFIIGPLGKDYADQVSYINSQSVPTVLLGGEASLQGHTTRFTMTPEQEGIRVAERALQDGHLSAALLVPDTVSSQRVIQAFNARWLQSGGKISKVVSYTPSQFDHSLQLKQLFNIDQSELRHRQLGNTLGFRPKFSAYQRNDIDFIFMIADNESGRIMRPQINFFSGSAIPVYATSAIFNGIQDTINNMDLDKTTFPVMPWVLKSSDVAPYAGQLNMLYAMGGDAYRIAGNFSKLKSDADFALNGNTGQISISHNANIIYQPVWATFEKGEVVATDTLGIDLTPLKQEQTMDVDEFGNPIPSNEKGVYNESNWDHRESRRKTGS